MATFYYIEYTKEGASLKSVEVIETKKMYKLPKWPFIEAFGYLTQLQKDDKRVHTTPLDAITYEQEKVSEKVNFHAHQLSRFITMLEQLDTLETQIT